MFIHPFFWHEKHFDAESTLHDIVHLIVHQYITFFIMYVFIIMVSFIANWTEEKYIVCKKENYIFSAVRSTNKSIE